MDANPYEPPKTGERRHVPAAEPTGDRRPRSKWGCPVALLIGVVTFLTIAGPLAGVDDTGGLQMLISAFVGVGIYVLLFRWTD